LANRRRAANNPALRIGAWPRSKRPFDLGEQRVVIKAKLGAAAPMAAEDLVALGLTARQTEILTWLAGGKTDREIAKILAISPRTVSHTLALIYRRLGVENRVGAVARALRHGRR
jgi:DNA-binding CsgD family transcriptional regulator